MDTLVVATMPASGHVNPLLPVIEELTRTGLRVVIASTAEFEQAIVRAGGEFVAYPSATPTSRDIADATAHGGSVEVINRVLRATPDTVPILTDLVRQTDASAVLHDSNALWGHVAAHVTDRRTVSFMTTILVGSAAVRQLHGRELLTELGPSLRSLPGAVSARRAVRRAFGAEAVPSSPMFPMRGDLTIFPVPRELQPDDDRIDDTCVYVGPTAHDSQTQEPDAELAAFLVDESPLVYVSLGTLHAQGPEFFVDCVRALEGMRVVLSTGGAVDPSALGALPPTVLARRAVPQLSVLARADAFVTHGGMNSAMESMAAGVPMVVVPQQVEQLLIGQALADRGAAVVLREHLSRRRVAPQALRVAVDRMRGPRDARSAARAISAEFRRGGGAAAAASAIVDFLNRTL